MLVVGLILLFRQVMGSLPPSLFISFFAYVLTLPSVVVGLMRLFSIGYSDRE